MNNIIKHENGRQPADFETLVDQIFQQNLNRFFDEDAWISGVPGKKNRSGNIPVNIKVAEKKYEMEVYAPGLKKENFQLNIEGDLLTIFFENHSGNKEEDKAGGWSRQEYKKQSFYRSFSIGETVDTTQITAHYENGVLYIDLPKKEQAQRTSKPIEIK